MKTLQEIKDGEGTEIAEANIKSMPMILMLKRKAYRQFPSGQFVALYHSDKLGMDISIPYSPNRKEKEVSGIVSTEETLIEAVHDDLFGDYTEALKKHFETGTRHTDHPELLKMKAKVIHKYGKEAHGHLHAAAEHMLNGDLPKAARRYNKFERTIDEEFRATTLWDECVDAELVGEATIHKLHQITKTKQDGEIVFSNGARHKMSHAQAAHIMRMHTMATPENKATIEKHLNSPEGLTKVADFAAQNLK